MGVSNKIISVFSPTIQLEEIAIKDTESNDQQLTVSSDHNKPSKVTGHFAPYVKINGYVFDHNDIHSLTLSETGFLPTVQISLRDTRGIFKSAYFPKTKPIMSLYIRSMHDKMKCIRCDFIIGNILSDSSNDSENHMAGKNMDLTIYGILIVPNLYSSIPQSFSNQTSYDVLQNLAYDMQLGFATNEEYTNDKMTWIKPIISKNNFIRHVLMHSFKDDNSFYMGFVDKYYHLNFLNLAEMLVENDDFDQMYERVITFADIYTKQSDDTSDDVSSDFILTNLTKLANSNVFIKEYKPETAMGSILIKNGYVRTISYYDQQLSANTADNFVTLDIRPISVSLLPGDDSPNDTLATLASNLGFGEWCGIDYNNGHNNFNYSQIQNEHNNNEIRKITLNITLSGVNLNLSRGMRVPVVIFRENQGDYIDEESYGPDDGSSKASMEKSESTHLIKDKWLSGYYVVGDLTYEYDVIDGFNTSATLLRSNWNKLEEQVPLPVK